MNARTKAIAKKEVKQLLRDKRMMFVVFFFPVFLLAIFGYAVNFDVTHIKLAVYDNDKSDLSRDLINTLSSSDYFDVAISLENDEQIKETLEKKYAQCVMVIPIDFSEKFYNKKKLPKYNI